METLESPCLPYHHRLWPQKLRTKINFSSFKSFRSAIWSPWQGKQPLSCILNLRLLFYLNPHHGSSSKQNGKAFSWSLTVPPLVSHREHPDPWRLMHSGLVQPEDTRCATVSLQTCVRPRASARAVWDIVPLLFQGQAEFSSILFRVLFPHTTRGI